MAKESGETGHITPPKTADFLPKAIRNAVLDIGIKHPATIYPVAIGVSSSFVGWLFGLPFLYIIALAGILLGPAWAVSQIFFFNEKIGSSYIRRLNEKQQEYERYVRESLEIGLKECRNIKGLEEHATQGAEQCKSIKTKLENIQELLELKLRSGEITFGRFLGAAEQVSLSVLDNLQSVVSTLKSASSINTDYIRNRFDELARRGQRTEDDIKEEEALKKRLHIREDQLFKVNRLLTLNEEAMTEMENISAAVADWQTDGRFADTDFESAITRLQELAEHAHEYNT